MKTAQLLHVVRVILFSNGNEEHTTQ